RQQHGVPFFHRGLIERVLRGMFEPSRIDHFTIPLLFLDKPVRTLEADHQRIELRLRGYGFKRFHSQNKINEVQRLDMGRLEHCFNDIVPQGMDDLGIVTNPLKDEFDNAATAFLFGTCHSLETVIDHDLSCMTDTFSQIQSEAALKNNSDNRSGVSAKRKGIFGPRWHKPNMKKCREG